MANGYPENKGHKGIVYPSPIFGPIHSRRLGVSLGINLMPADGKVCTFDCVYCECGFRTFRYRSTTIDTVRPLSMVSR